MTPEVESFPPISKLKRRKPKKRNPFWRVGGILALVLVFVATAYAGFVYYKFKNFTSTIAGYESGSDAPKVVGEPMAMVLLGMDSRDETRSLNTDVIMVAVFNPKNKTATVLSIPRDTYIKVEGFRSGKANSFYSRGELSRSKAEKNGEVAPFTGPSMVKEVLSKYLDIPITHYATIDFEAFRQVVDSLGGVRVYVDQDMRYVDNADGTNINLRKGEQSLNGKEALDFVRFRKSNQGGPDSNDIERNQRQQLVVSTLIDKIFSVRGALNIGEILDIAGGRIRTDLTEKQMNTLFKTYFGVTSDQIRFISLQGEWNSPYILVTEQDLAAVKAQLKDTLEGNLMRVNSNTTDSRGSSKP